MTTATGRIERLVARLRSGNTLTQKASLNALAAALDYGARMLTTFVITPFLVSGLGDFLYGIWLIVGRLTGYLSAAGGFLTDAERKHLVAAGEVITFEQGVRFLGDFLDGDIYYKTTRPAHNLDRARNQFRLVESIIEHGKTMNECVERLAR